MKTTEAQIGQIGHASLPEAVYQGLRRAILNGELKPGDVLRQEQLAQQLGVSRAPLREALPRLEAEGVVVLHPRRGYSVVSLDPEEISEIFALREIVEGRATALGATRRDDKDVARVRQILADMAVVDTLTPAGRSAWFNLNLEFHEVITSASKCRHIGRVLTMLRTAVEPYIRVEAALTGDVDQAHGEHLELAEAFIAGNAVLAEERARAHVRHTASRLLGGIGQDNIVSLATPTSTNPKSQKA